MPRKPREPKPTDLLTAGDIAAEYGWPMTRAESLFWAIARSDQAWVYFEGYRRHFIERRALESRIRRGSTEPPPTPETHKPSEAGRARFGRAHTALVGGATLERREGFYIGTDKPHTDVDGIPLSPDGRRWQHNVLSTDGEAFFIRHVSGGPIRIGYSIDAEYFAETMNLNSHDLGYRVLAAIPGGKAATRDLHSRFRHLRIHGGWFLAEPELLAHIDEIIGPHDPLEEQREVQR